MATAEFSKLAGILKMGSIKDRNGMDLTEAEDIKKWQQYAESESENEVAQSCPTLCDPVDCSPPGSSTHGILQARILEWVAISGREHSSSYQQKLGLKVYWALSYPPEQVFPTANPFHQEAYTSLLSSSIKGKTEWKSQSQKTNQTDHMDHSLV